MRSIVRLASPLLLAATLYGCGQGKLVQVPDRNANGETSDVPDAGPLGLLPSEVPIERPDAGAPLRDAGEPKPADGGTSGGATSGGTTSGGATGGSGGATGAGTTGSTGNGSSGGGSAGSSGGTTGGTGARPDAGPTCDTPPDPGLAGDWTMNSDYNLGTVAKNGLPPLLNAVNDINTFLQALSSYGAPVPAWATALFGDLANLDALYQDIQVVSDLELTSQTAPRSYLAQETWNSVTVMQNGTPVALDAGNAGFTSPPAYGVTTCNGTATFESHDLGSALSGLLPPILDGITNIATCSNGQCYSSFDAAVQGTLDCSQYTGFAAIFCAGASAGLLAELHNALAKVAVGFNVATVEGTAHIADVNDLVNGIWVGNSSGTPFSGTFSATRN